MLHTFEIDFDGFSTAYNPKKKKKKTDEGKFHTMLKAEESKEAKSVWSCYNCICPPVLPEF